MNHQWIHDVDVQVVSPWEIKNKHAIAFVDVGILRIKLVCTTSYLNVSLYAQLNKKLHDLGLLKLYLKNDRIIEPISGLDLPLRGEHVLSNLEELARCICFHLLIYWWEPMRTIIGAAMRNNDEQLAAALTLMRMS